MSGKLTELVAQIMKIVPSVSLYHWEVVIVDKARRTKTESVRIINYVKNKLLNSRLFSSFVKKND